MTALSRMLTSVRHVLPVKLEFPSVKLSGAHRLAGIKVSQRTRMQRANAKVYLGRPTLKNLPEGQILGSHSIVADNHMASFHGVSRNESIPGGGPQTKCRGSRLVVFDIETLLDAGAVHHMMSENPRIAERKNCREDAGTLREPSNQDFRLLFQGIGPRSVLIDEDEIGDGDAASQNCKQNAWTQES